jgi:branched-chain amino acid transport system permease protein/neutral amino acid transport system permease protein
VSLIPGIIAFGLYSACLYAIGAVGFTLQFGVTNVLNLAYGAILTSAMYVDYALGHGSPSIWFGILVGAVWGALASLVFGRLIVLPYVRRGTSLVTMAMVTIGVGLIVQYTLQSIQGPFVYSYQVAQQSTVQIAGVTMSEEQLIIIGAAVVLMIAVHSLLQYTRLGLAMRATAVHPSLARSCGVSTELVRNAAWLISGALCGISGVLLGISTGSFDSVSGASFFITVVVAAIIGGVGKPYGAMIGALILGLVSEAAAAVIAPDYKDIVAWVILIVVLVIRPQGIFAEFSSGRELIG